MDVDANFGDYKRVSDTLLYLDLNYSLVFTTVLISKNQNGGDSFFASEYMDQEGHISIYRQIKCYYVIQEKNTFGGGFLLWPHDVYFLCKTIEEKIFPWFFGNENIFAVKENKLIVLGKYSPVDYIRSMEQFLKFYPVVVTFKDGSEKEGVRIYVSSEEKYMDIDIDKLVQLYYILKNSDMMNLAYNALSYAKIGPHGKDIQKSGSAGLGGTINSKSITNNWTDDTYKRGIKKGERKFTPSNFLKNAKTKKDDE